MARTEATPRKKQSVSGATQQFKLSSPAFADGATIPQPYTGDGENVSPMLSWDGAPQGTESFALVCDDPDAPSGTFVHWLAWNIKADQHELPEGFSSDTDRNVRQGQNGFGKTGYAGPRPPPGKPHRYLFHLYALDARPDLPDGAKRNDFDAAIEGHVLGEARLTGMYARG